MKWIKSSLVFLFCSSCFLFGVDREVIANYVASPPKIDGKLDDAVWKNGVWFTDFSLLSDPTALAKVQTEFQVAYDDEYLYFAIHVDEPEPGSLKITEFLRDGGVCRDDSIEIMIDPYGDRYEYFHFITNAIGIKYDARQTHGGEFYDVMWDSSWKVATKIDSNAWTLEVAIPLSELSLNKKSEGTWTFNVARHRVGKEEEFSSFSPMMGSFHIAQKFSKLNMSGAKLDKFFWGIKRPFDYHIEAYKGDWMLTGKVQVANEGSPNEKFQLLFKQVNKKGAMVLDVMTAEIPIGGEKEFTFCLPIEKQEPLELQVEVVDIDNAKDIYRVKKVPLDIDYKAMELKLVSPSYRNCIYPSENITELKMLLRLTLAPKVLRGSTLRVRLLSEKADLIAEKEYKDLSNIRELTLPIGIIVPGSYLIEAQVVESDGDIVAKSSQVLKKLKNVEYEWRLDGNGTLLHNGAPFMPKGWFGMLPGEMQLISGSPYNSLFVSKDIIPDEQEAKKYLDAVSKVKGYAVMHPYTGQEMGSKQNSLRPLTSIEIKAIQQRVKSLKKHPALMAWVIAYEPEFDAILPSRIKQVYAIIVEEDPFHPAIILNSSIGGIREYSGIADITMTNTAITFLKDGGATRRIDSVSYYLDVANKIAHESITLWAGLEAYGYTKNWTELVRVPTFTELRNMCYQAVIGRVKGFFWNNYLYTYNYPEVRIGIEHLAKELTLLEAAILNGEVSDKLKLECDDSNVIYYAMRTLGMDRYFFIVNTGALAQQISFTAPLDGMNKLYVLSEKRVIKVQEGRAFEDYFEPYAAHIYSTKPLDSDLQSLEEVQVAIDLANKARKKPGNLAFEDSGVQILASSMEDPSSIMKLNDGVFDGIAWTSKKGQELPQWIEFSWGKPVKIAKIVIYSDTIENAKVQVKHDGTWVDAADFKRRSGGHLRATFKETEVDQIRILIMEKKPGVNSVTLSEVEVYNASTQEPD